MKKKTSDDGLTHHVLPMRIGHNIHVVVVIVVVVVVVVVVVTSSSSCCCSE